MTFKSHAAWTVLAQVIELLGLCEAADKWKVSLDPPSAFPNRALASNPMGTSEESAYSLA